MRYTKVAVKYQDDYDKVVRVIYSCRNHRQLTVAGKMGQLLVDKARDVEVYPYVAISLYSSLAHEMTFMYSVLHNTEKGETDAI